MNKHDTNRGPKRKKKKTYKEQGIENIGPWAMWKTQSW